MNKEKKSEASSLEAERQTHRRNCSKIFLGRNVNILYLVVDVLLDGNPFDKFSAELLIATTRFVALLSSLEDASWGSIYVDMHTRTGNDLPTNDVTGCQPVGINPSKLCFKKTGILGLYIVHENRTGAQIEKAEGISSVGLATCSTSKLSVIFFCEAHGLHVFCPVRGAVHGDPSRSCPTKFSHQVSGGILFYCLETFF